MTGLHQTAAQKLRDLVDELSVTKIVDEIIEKATAPARAESESLRKLVNETNERASREVATAADTLRDKQNEVIELRAQLADSDAKVIAASNELGRLQAESAALRVEVERLKESLKPATDPVTAD